MSIRNLRAELYSELDELKKLHQDFQEYTSEHQSPYSWDELRVLAGLLHDFYNGVENIFKRVINRIDHYPEILQGEDSHHAILKYMTQDVENIRPAFLSEDICDKLEEYLRFRHLVRHAYGHRYKEERMKPLIDNYPQVFSAFLQEVENFIETELFIE